MRGKCCSTVFAMMGIWVEIFPSGAVGVVVEVQRQQRFAGALMKRACLMLTSIMKQEINPRLMTGWPRRWAKAV